MANWTGVITNSGKALLGEWINEKTLNFDRAAAGTGTVTQESLLAQTALVSEKQKVSILGAEAVSAGIRLKLRIAAPETGYSLTQYGVWASVDGGTPALIALFQHNAGGVPIPSAADSPDFVFTFYALISTSNTGSWTVSVDTSTVATMEELHEYIKGYYANVGSALIRDINIPASGWKLIGSGAVGDYKYTIDVALTEAMEEHFPTMALDLMSSLVAAAAGLCPTIQTHNGVVRFWAQEPPAADLTGTIMLRSENLMQTGTGSGGGGVSEDDIATDEDVTDMLDEVFGAPGTDQDGSETDDNLATDEEVKEVIDEIYGGDSSEGSGNTENGDSTTDDSISGVEIATDKEVKDTIDDIFG